jgi:hypothetical protein
MKRLCLFILLACFSVSAFAQTGILYNPERTGEGILVHQNVFATSLYFFTYGAEQCDPVDLAALAPEPRCDLNGQRWYFASDKDDEGQVRGLLYAASGVNYPEGIQSPDDPFVQILGKSYPVGEYRLRPLGEGWVLEVVHTSRSPLDEVDPLFGTYFFDVVLFEND